METVRPEERSCKIIDFAVSGDSMDWGEWERSDRKISRLGNGVIEDMEC